MYKYKIYFDDSGIPNRMFEEKPLEEQMYIFMEIFQQTLMYRWMTA
ncbi:MAG: hypothetical protein GX959_03585 [Clostridiales bacterium]|jgi:hypothetical protein|nr:hypothetical protein [Clostridiales bacterium]